MFSISVRAASARRRSSPASARAWEDWRQPRPRAGLCRFGRKSTRRSSDPSRSPSPRWNRWLDLLVLELSGLCTKKPADVQTSEIAPSELRPNRDQCRKLIALVRPFAGILIRRPA
jgi:hypothetical protein